MQTHRSRAIGMTHDTSNTGKDKSFPLDNSQIKEENQPTEENSSSIINVDTDKIEDLNLIMKLKL